MAGKLPVGESQNVTVLISDIKIGDRYRRDLGDLKSLADSISTQGLLQPIGITKDNDLVFGERRLTACRDVLGLTEIEARIVDVTSIVEGEHDENEVRKDFTVSERHAIGEALKAELGERRGRPGEIQDNCPEYSGTQTRDIAAKAAGFSSGKSFERAGNVIERGTPELQDAMDKEEISISAASEIAKLPKEEQNNVVQLRPTERKQALRDIRSRSEQLRQKDQERARADSAKALAEIEKMRNSKPDLLKVVEFLDYLRDIAAYGISGHRAFYLATTAQKQEMRELIPVASKFVEEAREACNAKAAI